MTIAERIEDINSTGNFNGEEVEKYDNFTMMFKSIEYHSIFHLTNAELYYISDEELLIMTEGADLREETTKGIIYGHK